MDGDAKHLVLPNSTRAFWKTLTAIDVELVDTAGSLRVDKRHLDKLDTARSGGAIVETVIEANHACPGSQVKITGEANINGSKVSLLQALPGENQTVLTAGSMPIA